MSFSILVYHNSSDKTTWSWVVLQILVLLYINIWNSVCASDSFSYIESLWPFFHFTLLKFLFQFKTGYFASSKFYLSCEYVRANLSVYRNLMVPVTNGSQKWIPTIFTSFTRNWCCSFWVSIVSFNQILFFWQISYLSFCHAFFYWFSLNFLYPFSDFDIYYLPNTLSNN